MFNIEIFNGLIFSVERSQCIYLLALRSESQFLLITLIANKIKPEFDSMLRDRAHVFLLQMYIIAILLDDFFYSWCSHWNRIFVGEIKRCIFLRLEFQ